MAVDRSKNRIRILTKRQAAALDELDYLAFTPSDRLEMVDIITKRCWELMGTTNLEPGLSRHVVRIRWRKSIPRVLTHDVT